MIVYNQTSGGPCYFFDILEVPLDAPQDARLIRQEPLEGEHACHDSGVILGDVNKMACASGHMTNVFDIGENDTPGGSLTNPKFLFGVEEEGVGPIEDPPPGVEHSGSWHSATFTWDGEVLILGWEPGGGVEPECEATDPPVQKSAFFYDADTGEKLGSVDAAAATVSGGELHDPQLQRRADQEPLHPDRAATTRPAPG